MTPLSGHQFSRSSGCFWRLIYVTVWKGVYTTPHQTFWPRCQQNTIGMFTIVSHWFRWSPLLEKTQIHTYYEYFEAIHIFVVQLCVFKIRQKLLPFLNNVAHPSVTTHSWYLNIKYLIQWSDICRTSTRRFIFQKYRLETLSISLYTAYHTVNL